MHNDCWHALPSDAKQVANINGYKAYQFKDPKDGKVVTVVQKDLNRFETPSHQNGVDPHFNRLSQQIDAERGRYLSTDNPVDGLYNRAYLRSETLQKIYANYEKLPNGNIIKGPIDIGHMYGWEHRRLSLAAKELNWSQKQLMIMSMRERKNLGWKICLRIEAIRMRCQDGIILNLLFMISKNLKKGISKWINTLHWGLIFWTQLLQIILSY